MRFIRKRGQEPAALLSYRKTGATNQTWEALPSADKESVRKALREDQGEICCYCMARIKPGDMKVEHYRPRSKHPSGELEWRNLLAACSGGEGGPHHQQTCDTSKGHHELTVNPLSETVERQLSYGADGKIKSHNPDVLTDIETLLNLNIERLKRGRQQAIDSLVKVLTRRYGADGRWSKRQLEEQLGRLRAARPCPPYLGLYEYWLTKAIARRDR